MATTVQLLNFSTVSHRVNTTSGKVNLPPALRRGTQATGLAGAAVSVDLATINTSRGIRKLLENGTLIVLPTGTLS